MSPQMSGSRIKRTSNVTYPFRQPSCHRPPLDPPTNRSVSSGEGSAIDGVVFHTERGRLTPQPLSPYCARTGSGSDGSVRASTTPPSRSSPPSNTRSCPVTTSPPRPKRGPSCGLVPRVLQTTNADTARPHCCHPASTRRSPSSNRKRHKEPSTIRGEAHGVQRGASPAGPWC